MASVRKIALFLTVFVSATLAPAVAAEPSAKPPAVWFIGYPHFHCGFEMASRLDKEGLAVNAMHHPGLEGPALTWEQLKRYNVLVVAGLGHANSDMSLTDKNKANLELLNRFIVSILHPMADIDDQIRNP